MSRSLTISEIEGAPLGLGQRLLEARKGAGLSARAAVEQLPSRLKVSHTGLLKFERDELRPKLDLLVALATIYERPVDWFLSRSDVLTCVHYRNVPSRTTAGEKAAFESRAAYWLTGYRRIEAKVKAAKPASVINQLREWKDESAADAASAIRKWVLKIEPDQPVVSAIDFLEIKVGARVIEIDSESRIDGLAATLRDEHVVVLNDSLSNDRLRTSALHEAAHIIRGDCELDSCETKEQERWAFDFASHLLLPSIMLRQAFDGKSMLRLLQFKERFGISIASMVYRAEREHLLSKAEARWLWIQFSKRGWKRVEPGRVWADRATRFDSLLETALREKKMSMGEIAQIMNVTEREVRRRLERRYSEASSIGDLAHEQREQSPQVVGLRLVR